MNDFSTSPQDLMTAKLFFNAAFPVMQVVLDDDPAMKAKFRNVAAVVQICAKDGDGLLACHLVFNYGKLSINQGPAQVPDIILSFNSVAKMNTMFRGGAALPSIKGFLKVGLLIKVFSLPKLKSAGLLQYLYCAFVVLFFEVGEFSFPNAAQEVRAVKRYLFNPVCHFCFLL